MNAQSKTNDHLLAEIMKLRQRIVELEVREEKRFRNLFEYMLDGVAYCQMLYHNGRPDDFIYLSVNPAFEALTGLRNVVGKRATEVIPGIKETMPELFDIYARVAESGHAERVEMDFRPLKIWLNIAVYSTERGYFVAVFENITERKRAEKKMIWLASFPELNPNPVIEIEVNGQVHYLNPAARQLFPDLAMLGLAHPYLRDLETVVEMFRTEAMTMAVRDIKLDHVCYQQSLHVVNDNARVRIYGIDITERKRAEEALQESEEKFRSLAENSQDYIMRYDRDGRHLYENPSALRVSGLRAEDIIGKTHREVGFAEDLCAIWEEKIQRVFTTGEPSQAVFDWQSVEGRVYLDWRLFPEFDPEGTVTTVLGVSRDITELKRAEERLRTALAEKETLLRELYHRTKNNMQVIRAMLVLQAASCQNAEITAFVQEIEQKILAMALVHQKLYQSQDLSRIDLSEYLTELVDLLIQSYTVASHRIALRLELERVSVLIDTAIPCGLIVNELMSNALKYAFPEERAGEIRMSLCRTSAGFIELSFADNGVGVPESFDVRAQPTLGLQTIVALAEQQLKGEMDYDRQSGLAYVIRFRDNLYTPRV